MNKDGKNTRENIGLPPRMKTTVRLRKLSYWHDEMARLAKEGSSPSVVRRALLDHGCEVSLNAVKKYLEVWEERGWPGSAELGLFRLQKHFDLSPWKEDLAVPMPVPMPREETPAEVPEKPPIKNFREETAAPPPRKPERLAVTGDAVEEWVPGKGLVAKNEKTSEPRAAQTAGTTPPPLPDAPPLPAVAETPSFPDENLEEEEDDEEEEEEPSTPDEPLSENLQPAFPQRIEQIFPEGKGVPFSVGETEPTKAATAKKSFIETLEREEIAASNRSAIVQSPQVEKGVAELCEGDPLGVGWRGYDTDYIWWEVLIGDLKKQLDEERAMRWSGRQVDYSGLRWEDLGWFDLFGMYRWGNKDYDMTNEIKELLDRVYMQSRKYVMINWQEGTGDRKTLFVVTPGSRLQRAIAEKMDFMHMPRWWRRKMEVEGWVLPSAAGWDNDDGRSDAELGSWTMRTPKFQQLKAKLNAGFKGEEEPPLPAWYLKKSRAEWLQGLPAGRI